MVLLWTAGDSATTILDDQMAVGRRNIDAPRDRHLAIDCMLSGKHAFGSKETGQLAGVASGMKSYQDGRCKMCRKICHKLGKGRDAAKRRADYHQPARPSLLGSQRSWG
ncbi:hypothetical protein A9977_10260 [Variovorax sp. UMC13]|nr:hypothetical protein [Variovorax sp. UMC13]